MSDDELAALRQAVRAVDEEIFGAYSADKVHSDEYADKLAARGGVVLPPAVAEVLRTGEPSREMMYAAFMVLEGYEEIPWTLAKTHGEDVQVVTKLLRAALAVLR